MDFFKQREGRSKINAKLVLKISRKPEEKVLWYHQDKVVIRGNSHRILPLEDHGYRSSSGEFSSAFFWVGDKILFIRSLGTARDVDILNIAECIGQILKQRERSKYFLIWQFDGVEHLGLKVRQALLHIQELQCDLWAHQYYALPGSLRIPFEMHRRNHPESIGEISLVRDAYEALKQIIHNKPQKPASVAVNGSLTRYRLNQMSKQHLIDLMLNSQRLQRDRVRELMDTITKITWDGTFEPVKLFSEQNDPYFELYEAINLLQEDVSHSMGELRELNQNLGNKVAARITDIIQKEANLRTLLDYSDSMTCLINHRCELIDYNSGFADEFERRYSAKLKAGKNLLHYFSDPEMKHEWGRRLERTLDGKPGFYVEQSFESEEDRVLEVKTYPIKEEGVKIKGVAIFIKDITDVKRSQLKLIEKNRDMDKLNKELDNFVYRVSHDLRAPLTSIMGLINLIKIESDHDKLVSYIDLQEKSVKKLDSFIRNIINMSRNSRLGVAVERINFQDILLDIFETVNMQIESPLVEKRMEINGEIPFYSDLQRVHIILNNLITNSVKYYNNQEACPYVHVRIEADEKEAFIEVSDNGLGVPPEYINKIFTMFFRLSNTNAGAGLGLYMVKETVTKLEGTIQVKSKVREGTTFVVRLPNLRKFYDTAILRKDEMPGEE